MLIVQSQDQYLNQSFKNPISNASKIISKCANIAAQRELTN